MFVEINIGVQTAETELSTSKVTVTGTMDADRLVDYVYRRTKKQARIVPQPEPEKQEENKEGEKPAEEAKPEEKKEENAEKAEEGKPPEEAKKGEEGNGGENNESKEDKGGENKEEGKVGEIPMDDETMKRMMYYYQPLYVIERMPPPQLFSDENPNACCIS